MLFLICLFFSASLYGMEQKQVSSISAFVKQKNDSWKKIEKQRKTIQKEQLKQQKLQAKEKLRQEELQRKLNKKNVSAINQIPQPSQKSDEKPQSSTINFASFLLKKKRADLPTFEKTRTL